MEDKHKQNTSQLFNFTKDSYLERTSRPIYALLFLLPFILVYEFGTIFINTDILNQMQIRVVAFVWLQDFLLFLGFTNKLAWMAPALAVVIILIALQLVSGKKWSFSFSDLMPMAIECILLAVPLIVFSMLINSPPQTQPAADNYAVQSLQVQRHALIECSSVANENSPSESGINSSSKTQSLLTNIVTGIGAGIYEELVFRLILICLLMLLFQDCLRMSHKNSIILSVLLSAALFSAHHHVIFFNGHFDFSAPFTWPEFGFRTVAGVYFAALFAVRGFGIAAGTHAFYDIIATIINTAIFQS